MTILIDPREGSANLINHPPLSTTATLATLPSADVLITGNGPNGPISIGVELKSIADLMASSASGRLTTQLERMTDTYGRIWLLTYGPLATNPAGHLLSANANGRLVPVLRTASTPYQFTEYYSLLNEVAECHIHHAHTDTYATAALWVARLAHFWHKPYRCHRRLATLELPATTLIPRYAAADTENARMKLALRIAACLPHISSTRALAVAQHFASIRDMVTATVDQWREVAGIGKTTATAAVEMLNRRRP